MTKKVTLIPGDGIGPEIVWAVKEVFTAAKVDIQWEEELAGPEALEKKGELIPASLVESVRKNKIALKAPITTPLGKGYKSINVQLRQIFDLYANVRPSKNIPGIKTRFENVDLVIIRENTEGMYSGLEIYDERLGISDSIGRITKAGCDRVVRFAFEYAAKNNRKKVSLVHKANILKSAGALFLDAGARISKDYPGIQMEDLIIDNMCMQLVTKPERFDVIVTTNLFGDILSDLCAGLVGGLGIASGINFGKEVAIFEAVHGSAPDIAGKWLANPTAILKSAILMLDYMGEKEKAQQIDQALDKTLGNKEQCTKDLGGNCGSKEFVSNIISNFKS